MENDINEMSELAGQLSTKLQKTSEADQVFNSEVGQYLEMMSWEMLKMQGDLKQLRNLLF